MRLRVTVVANDERWPQLSAAEAESLERALARWRVTPVQRIRSTSVRRLAAEPVLGMAVRVASLPQAREALRLGDTPAEQRPHEALSAYEQATDRCTDGTAQLHLTQVDSAPWRQRLTFRDALRTDSALRNVHGALKRSLAAPEVLLTEYTAGKRAFVAPVLAGAHHALKHAALVPRGGADVPRERRCRPVVPAQVLALRVGAVGSDDLPGDAPLTAPR